MGYSGYEVENALYGYKEDIKEQLNNDDPPKWLLTEYEWKNKKDNRVGDHVSVSYSHKKYTVKDQDNRLRKLPKDIRKKCEDWLENNKDGIEVSREARSVKFRYFELDIKLNSNDTVEDLTMFAMFRDH